MGPSVAVEALARLGVPRDLAECLLDDDDDPSETWTVLPERTPEVTRLVPREDTAMWRDVARTLELGSGDAAAVVSAHVVGPGVPGTLAEIEVGLGAEAVAAATTARARLAPPRSSPRGSLCRAALFLSRCRRGEEERRRDQEVSYEAVPVPFAASRVARPVQMRARPVLVLLLLGCSDGASSSEELAPVVGAEAPAAAAEAPAAAEEAPAAPPRPPPPPPPPPRPAPKTPASPSEQPTSETVVPISAEVMAVASTLRRFCSHDDQGRRVDDRDGTRSVEVPVCSVCSVAYEYESAGPPRPRCSPDCRGREALQVQATTEVWAKRAVRYLVDDAVRCLAAEHGEFLRSHDLSSRTGYAAEQGDPEGTLSRNLELLRKSARLCSGPNGSRGAVRVEVERRRLLPSGEYAVTGQSGASAPVWHTLVAKLRDAEPTPDGLCSLLPRPRVSKTSKRSGKRRRNETG